MTAYTANSVASDRARRACIYHFSFRTSLLQPAGNFVTHAALRQASAIAGSVERTFSPNVPADESHCLRTVRRKKVAESARVCRNRHRHKPPRAHDRCALPIPLRFYCTPLVGGAPFVATCSQGRTHRPFLAMVKADLAGSFLLLVFALGMAELISRGRIWCGGACPWTGTTTRRRGSGCAQVLKIHHRNIRCCYCGQRRPHETAISRSVKTLRPDNL